MKYNDLPIGMMHKADASWKQRERENRIRRRARVFKETVTPYIETGLMDETECPPWRSAFRKIYLKGTTFYIKVEIDSQFRARVVWADYGVYEYLKTMTFPEVFEACPPEIKKKLVYHLDVFGPVDMQD
jgi:hypothetical protein